MPALFEQNVGAVDEWTLSTLLAQKGSDTLQQTMENHYKTFITEEDIAQIAGAGLNWIRLPIPFWAIETWSNVGDDATTGQPIAEPFLARVCWQCVFRCCSASVEGGLTAALCPDTYSVCSGGHASTASASTSTSTPSLARRTGTTTLASSARSTG